MTDSTAYATISNDGETNMVDDQPVSDAVASIQKKLQRDSLTAKKLWRQVVAVSADGDFVPLKTIRDVWRETGWEGDWEHFFRQDVNDLRTCRRAAQIEKADSLGQWRKEHGTRKDLWDQAAVLRQEVRGLESLIRQHDGLEKAWMVVDRAAALKQSNRRLFD